MRKQFVLFPNEDGWRLAIVGETVEFETVPSAEKVADILSRLERSPRVWVALPSHECLCATIATTGLPRKSGDALKFRLEEIFPWAAEDFIAIDLPSGSDQAFVVVTRRAELDARVGALREAGIVVAGVSPAALLAASRSANLKPTPSFSAKVLPARSALSGCRIASRSRGTCSPTIPNRCRID